jgi:ParB-like chromosome segregation protein Spo0J
VSESVPLAQVLGRRLRDAKVEEFRRAMEDGEDFPPVVLREVSVGRFAVVDGRHRVAAAEAAGLTWIEAVVEDL